MVKFATLAFVTLLSTAGAMAAPKVAARTVDPACPVTYTTTFVETLSIIAPTTTGPFETTTITETEVSYPLATTTEVESNGETTYTVTYTYTNWFGDPPYPSDCYSS